MVLTMRKIHNNPQLDAQRLYKIGPYIPEVC